ncbi:MAG: hypothetical protein KAU41_09775 [Deltaproteobacteria bacterium]|nr:hypothetical protein [Deltaproteobacteria bacterium]
MTKNIFITDLDEIKGIKVQCEKCNSSWYIPINNVLPPDKCIGCGEAIPGSKIAATMEKIKELQILSSSSKFKITIETDFEK